MASTHIPAGRTFTLTDPVSLDDIAERLGVQRHTPNMWRHRDLLPPPVFTIARVPVWDWPDVEQWAKATGRLGRAPAPAPTPEDPARYPASVLSAGNW